MAERRGGRNAVWTSHGRDTGSSEGAWQSWHTGTLQMEKETSGPGQVFQGYCQQIKGMIDQSNTHSTGTGKCSVLGTGEQKKLSIPSAEIIHIKGIVSQYWRRNYFCKAPSITFFQILEPTHIIFFG